MKYRLMLGVFGTRRSQADAMIPNTTHVRVTNKSHSSTEAVSSGGLQPHDKCQQYRVTASRYTSSFPTRFNASVD